MPELGSLPKSGISPQVFQPINPASYYIAPTPDTSAASGVAGKSALYGSIAAVLAKLPDDLTAAYKQGRQTQVANNVTKEYSQALNGQPTASGASLSDFTASGTGDVTMKVEDPAVKAARINHLNRLLTPRPKATTLWEQELHSNGVDPSQIQAPVAPRPVEPPLPDDDSASGGTASTSTGAPVMASDGSDFGRGTSYGYTGDTYGGPKATASKIGASGQPLDSTSLAVSPDVEGKLKAAGFKLGDLVTVHTDKGDVTRRWDDRTATDSEAAALKLSPLRGRWDFHATADGKPSPFADSRILGFSPAAAAGAPSAASGPLASFTSGSQGVPFQNNPGRVPMAQPDNSDSSDSPAPAPALASMSPVSDSSTPIPLAPAGTPALADMAPASPGDAAAEPIPPAAPTSGVSPEIQQMAEGAAINVGKQLADSSIPDSSNETAATGPVAGSDAGITPVTREQALAEFKAAHPAPAAPAGAAPAPAPGVARKTVDKVTGIVSMTTGDGRQYQLLPYANSWKEVKPAAGGATSKHPGFDSPEELQAFAQQHGMIPGNPKQGADGKWYSDNSTFLPKLDRDLQKRLNEANQLGAGINTAGKTADDINAELAKYQQESGSLTDAQLTHIQNLRGKYTSLPIYHTAQNVVDGYNNFNDAIGFKSGIGDKTAIEEGQRILNPQNGVRAQTIQMFGGSSGLLERLSPSYIAQHFEKGRIFTDEQAKEYQQIIDKAYKERVNDMAETAKQHISMAKRARVPEDVASEYFDNPYQAAVTRAAAAKAAAPAPAAANGAGASHDNPLPVGSAADYAAAPSGTWVKDSNGKIGKKP